MYLLLKKVLHFCFIEYAQPCPMWWHCVDQLWCFECSINLLLWKNDKWNRASGGFQRFLIVQNFNVTTTFLQCFVFAVLSISALCRMNFEDPFLSMYFPFLSKYYAEASLGVVQACRVSPQALICEELCCQEYPEVYFFWLLSPYYSLPCKYFSMNDDYSVDKVMFH